MQLLLRKNVQENDDQTSCFELFWNIPFKHCHTKMFEWHGRMT